MPLPISFLPHKLTMTDPPASTAADRQLMARLATGDEAALEDILERHWGALLDYATRWLDTPDIAQDLVQEAFIRLWDHRARWDGQSGARPILFRMVRNLAIDHRRHAAAIERNLRSLPVTSSTPPIGEALEEAELIDAVYKALDQLNPREREIVILSRIQGLTRSEVVAVTGLAPGTVSNLLSLGMTRLWRAVERLIDDTDDRSVRPIRSHLRKL